MPLYDYWSRLAPSETIHPDDRPTIEGRNHSFQFDLPPGHISGPLLSAAVVICYGNPGYDDNDRLAAQDPKKWALLAKQREGTEPYPMWLPGWKRWISERTKQMKLPAEVLSRTVATFNVVPYASVRMTDADARVALKLPSVEVARDHFHTVLVPKARREELFLIVIRKHVLWDVERVSESRTLRIPKNLYVGGSLGALGAEVRLWLDEGHHVNTAF